MPCETVWTPISEVPEPYRVVLVLNSPWNLDESPCLELMIHTGRAYHFLNKYARVGEEALIDDPGDFWMYLVEPPELTERRRLAGFPFPMLPEGD